MRFAMHIHFHHAVVLRFSLTSEFYLLFKYVIFAISKADYIIKRSIFCKTPFLEEKASFYPVVMHFTI